jgi:hypothetical protein
VYSKILGFLRNNDDENHAMKQGTVFHIEISEVITKTKRRNFFFETHNR